MKEYWAGTSMPASWNTVGMGKVTAAGSPAGIFDSVTGQTVVVAGVLSRRSTAPRRPSQVRERGARG